MTTTDEPTQTSSGSRSAHSSAGDAPEDGTVATRARLEPGLYVVSTPIGHARDITLRALDVLGAASVIAAEDTRVTRGLMQRYGIATPITAYHEHNAAAAGPQLIERMKGGDIVALVSDAGTPLISDPGYRLVQAAVEADVAVTVVPGASAVTAALAIAGLPTDRFCFFGFLPRKASARRRTLGEAAAVPATLIFYEAPHRLTATLADLSQTLGPRPAVVARELTKLFEEVRRGELSELAAHYAAAGAPKGEIVVLVGPPGEEAPIATDELDTLLCAALARHSLKQAVAEVTAATGLPRREVYARALALRQSD